MPSEATIKVLGIEVVQSIQNLRNKVPLLADKETIVRVYIRPTGLADSMPVRGTLEVRWTDAAGEKTRDIESEAVVQLRTEDIGGNDDSYVATQRRSLDLSLNFRLSADQIKEGKVRLRLKGVASILDGDPDVAVPDNETEVTFEHGPILRVRAVGFRVRDPRTGAVHAPKPGHFKSLRSYLERAFPVSKVEWSDITIDAPEGFEPPYSDRAVPTPIPDPSWQKKFDIGCAHLMAIRARDIDEGMDQRTHYYGMVYHPDDSFFGAVSNVPAVPRPDVIGIGAAELEDGSFGAHELAHTLGRLHPGCCGGQNKEDPDFPAAYHGGLSSSDSADLHHGLDVGDSVERPRVLPFDECYDLMTYCRPLWVSAYSYTGMLKRLRQEEELDEEGKPPPKGASSKYLQIVGTYDIEKNEGTLSYVFPVRTKSLAAEEIAQRVVVVGMDANGKKLFESNVELKRADATDLPQNSGAFQITVPARDNLSKLELKVDGELADSWSLADAPSSTPLKGASAGALSIFDVGAIKIVPPVTSPDDPYLLEITWPKPYDRDARHTVRARLLYQKWQTIAVDITDATTEVLLDRRRFELPSPPVPASSPVEVQILCSSGFSETPIFEGELTIGS